jgi:hypothetical protein
LARQSEEDDLVENEEEISELMGVDDSTYDDDDDLDDDIDDD